MIDCEPHRRPRSKDEGRGNSILSSTTHLAQPAFDFNCKRVLRTFSIQSSGMSDRMYVDQSSMHRPWMAWSEALHQYVLV